MELKTEVSKVNLLFYTFVVLSQGELVEYIIAMAKVIADSPFSIECSHTFDLDLNLAEILDLKINTNIRVINSYTSEIFVKSPCCQNITFTSNGVKCSLCSENGIKVCNISQETIEISSIQNTDCESKSDINLKCTRRICQPRNNTENVEVFRPGEETGCLMNNKTYMCSKYGNWTAVNCSYEAVQFSTDKTTNTLMTTLAQHTETYGNESETTTTTALNAGTSENSSDNGNTSMGQFITAEPYNVTDISTLYNIDTIVNGQDISNDTVSEKFQPEKAMKALYTFLIVLAVVLVLVSILVCVFFIRKKKDKVSISHVDYPLEYWHDREYIDNIVEKRFTPNSAFTVNPVFDNKGYGQTRYKKKEESDYKKRRSTAVKDHTSGVNEKPRRSNAFRTGSNGSTCGKADRPRKTKHDYADKYLATATGSNFYNYNPTQTQDVVKQTTDLDVSTEDECDRAHGPTNPSGTSSFTSSRMRAKQKGNHESKGDPNDQWNEHSPDVIEDNLYSVSYKEHLRRSLDYWSAEESDA